MWWSFDTWSCIYQTTDGPSGKKVSLVLVVLLGFWEALIAFRLKCICICICIAWFQLNSQTRLNCKQTIIPLTHSACASMQRNTRQVEYIPEASTENQATYHYQKTLILILDKLTMQAQGDWCKHQRCYRDCWALWLWYEEWYTQCAAGWYKKHF